jgi:hypothetical protein
VNRFFIASATSMIPFSSWRCSKMFMAHSILQGT